MADTTLPGLLLTGTHAARPAANTVGSGTLYSCSTHSLVYQSNASTWSTWAALGDPAALATHEADTTAIHGITDTSTLYTSGGTDVAVADGGTGSSTASGARTNLGLVIGTDVPAQATFDDHNVRHETGGGDAIKIDDLAAGDDNTDLNASTTKHGLLKKLSNVSTEFMNGVGNWATPAGGGGGGGALPGFVGAIVYHSTTQTLSANAKIAFDSEDADSNAFHDTSTNNSRLTIPAGFGGTYLLIGTLYRGTSDTPETHFIVNNTTKVRGSYRATAWGGGPTAVVALADGDYVEMQTPSSTATTGSATREQANSLYLVRLGGGGASVLSLAPTSDTSIEAPSWGNSGNTNYDTSTDLRIGSGTNTSWGVVGLMTFDISTLPTDVVSAVLYLCWTGSGDNGWNSPNRVIHARKMLRSYVSNQANWNIYSTGNNWGTAGAVAAADRSDEVFGVGQAPYTATPGSGATPIWVPVDLTPLVREAKGASETTLRVHLRFDHGADTGGSNPMTFASLDHGTARLRPSLRVIGA